MDTAGPSSLLEDIDRVFDMGHEDPALKLLRKAINLSLSQLHSEPNQLPSQLYGRLKGVELPHIEDLIAQIEEVNRPWLKTLSYCLNHAFGPIKQTLPVQLEVVTLTISSDDRWLAVLDGDLMLDVWDLNTGVHSYRKFFDSDYLGRDDDVAISNDGRYLLNIANLPYYHDTIRIWDLETDKEIHAIRGEVGGRVYSLDKETNYITEELPPRHTQKKENWIEAEIPGKVRPFRLVFGKFNHEDYVSTSSENITIYSDGKASVYVYDNSFKGKTPTITKHKSSYKSSLENLIISPDSQLAVSVARYDDTVYKFWSLKTGTELSTFQAPPLPVAKIKFDPTGKYLFYVEASGVTLCSVKSGEILWRKEIKLERTKDFILSSDGQEIIISNRFLKINKINLVTGEIKPPIPPIDGFFTPIALTQDGKRAAVNPVRGNIQIWDLYSDLVLQEFLGTKDHNFKALAITPDGNRVIAGGVHTLYVWDTNSGDVLLHQELNSGYPFEHISITPCGHRAVSAGDNYSLAVWDLDTGSKITSLTGDYKFTCVAISEDGSKIAAGDSEGIVYLLELENAPKLTTQRKPTQVHKLSDEISEPKQKSEKILENPKIIQKLQEYNTLNKKGQFDEALEIMDDLLEEFPDNSALLTFKSGVLTSLTRYQEVVNITSQLLERNDVPRHFIVCFTYHVEMHCPKSAILKLVWSSWKREILFMMMMKYAWKLVYYN